MVAYSDGLMTVACCHGGTSPTYLVDNRHYHLLFTDDFLRIRIAWVSREMIFGGYSSGKARDRT